MNVRARASWLQRTPTFFRRSPRWSSAGIDVRWVRRCEASGLNRSWVSAYGRVPSRGGTSLALRVSSLHSPRKLNP